MGYDYEECVFCYLQGRGNEPTNEIPYDVCFQCLESANITKYVGRVPSKISSRLGCISHGDCMTCVREEVFLISVNLCDDCKSKQ